MITKNPNLVCHYCGSFDWYERHISFTREVYYYCHFCKKTFGMGWLMHKEDYKTKMLH
jgi:transposase-like protein